MRKQLIFFVEGKKVPASRYRVFQYLSRLQKGGHQIRILTTRPSKYLYYPRLIRNSLLLYPWAAIQVGLIVLTRILQIVLFVPKADVVFLQRDLLFRVNTPFLEQLLFFVARLSLCKARPRLIFDVDDVIYAKKNGRSSETLERKIRYIAANCDLTIVGNSYLKDFFSQVSECELIPTCIDASRCVPSLEKDHSQSNSLVVGWTGTVGNLPYLQSLEKVLLELQRQFEFKFLIISDLGSESPFSSLLKNVELIEWRESRELLDLHRLHIGLMPLEDDIWTRGKCGFKLLQYMSIGIASVASPVGVNKDIIEHGRTGFLAASEQEWYDCLYDLLSDSRMRIEMGKAARKRLEETYDINLWYDAWLKAVLGNRK